MLTGFAVQYNGVLHTDRDSFTPVGQVRGDEAGLAQATSEYKSNDGVLEVRQTVLSTPEGASISWIEVRNISRAPVEIARVDSFHADLPPGAWTVHAYKSTWGHEFEPVELTASESVTLESRSGRSSNGMSPLFTLTNGGSRVLTASIAWSGNWIVRIGAAGASGLTISGGLSEWEFSKRLAPGESFRSPETISAQSTDGDIEEAAGVLTALVQNHWVPRDPPTEEMPVEWNTWWPYEDKRISEDVFKANVDVCALLGFDVCTLDAGWYGVGGSDLGWWERRGDWHITDSQRFPSGLAALADYTRKRGLKFGLWCEIEAVDPGAELNTLRPDIVARRDGNGIGHVCMGNPASVDWAFETVAGFIEKIGAEWLKFDSNFDPGAGCNRTDHGHGAGDGLYAHITGYYTLLDRIRARYPNVVLENCASGGLRFDLGIMKHMPISFLSDPDYTEHMLQITWAAFPMLPPRACLGFSWSQGHADEYNVLAEPITPDMPGHKFDYMIRAAMLRQFACSYRMPDLPDWCKDRLREQISLFKQTLRPYIRDAQIHRLTGQPLRGGGGDRWAGFQYAMPNGANSLLMVFRLVGGEPNRAFKLRGLDTEARYRVRFIDSSFGRQVERQATGRELAADGIAVSDLPEESSEIVLIERLSDAG